MRLGIDIDGCLADFNAGFRNALVRVTGKDQFNGEHDPPVWNYPAHYGYSDEETEKAWQEIDASPSFWETLDPKPGTEGLLRWLFWKQSVWDVYFLTNRPRGINTKLQTERWLRAYGFPRATVLIARGDKGALASGLDLTHVLDDRPENLIVLPPGVQRYLLLTRYNAWAAKADGMKVVVALEHFARELAG